MLCFSSAHAEVARPCCRMTPEVGQARSFSSAYVKCATLPGNRKLPGLLESLFGPLAGPEPRVVVSLAGAVVGEEQSWGMTEHEVMT